MTYTISKVKNRFHNGYEIGTGHKRKWTWQSPAVAVVLFTLAGLGGIVALAVFITVKFLMLIGPLIIFSWLASSIVMDAHRHSAEPFRYMPYRHDTYRESIKAFYRPETDLLEQLQELLTYPELKDLTDPDALTREAFNALKLKKSDGLKSSDVQEYTSILQLLIEKCKKRRQMSLFEGKESFDSVARSALEVAKKIDEFLNA